MSFSGNLAGGRCMKGAHKRLYKSCLWTVGCIHIGQGLVRERQKPQLISKHGRGIRAESLIGRLMPVWWEARMCIGIGLQAVRLAVCQRNQELSTGLRRGPKQSFVGCCICIYLTSTIPDAEKSRTQ